MEENLEDKSSRENKETRKQRNKVNSGKRIEYDGGKTLISYPAVTESRKTSRKETCLRDMSCFVVV